MARARQPPRGLRRPPRRRPIRRLPCHRPLMPCGQRRGLRPSRGGASSSEADFSHNGQTGQMLWVLLEALAQHEARVPVFKLFGNQISHGGVLAMCEFIRMNSVAEAVQELHLPRNDIDDASVLELIRTFQSQRPRCPPRRVPDGAGKAKAAPVWLRLKHNAAQDPEVVCKTAEEDGIAVCIACDRNLRSPSKCCRGTNSLVHLYAFTVQKHTPSSPQSPKQGSWRRDIGINGAASHEAAEVAAAAAPPQAETCEND